MWKEIFGSRNVLRALVFLLPLSLLSHSLSLLLVAAMEPDLFSGTEDEQPGHGKARRDRGCTMETKLCDPLNSSNEDAESMEETPRLSRITSAEVSYSASGEPSGRHCRSACGCERLRAPPSCPAGKWHMYETAAEESHRTLHTRPLAKRLPRNS